MNQEDDPIEVDQILAENRQLRDVIKHLTIELEQKKREAQIELSMERVRARAIDMRHSDELDELLTVLFDQFDVLGILPVTTHMTVIEIEKNIFTYRETGKFGDRSFGEQTVDIDSMDTWKDTAEQWRRGDPQSINRLHFPKEILPLLYEIFHETFASMPDASRTSPDDYPDGIYHTAGRHPFGYIGMNQTRKATEEEEEIVIKFATEFGRAYQRFLDLQKTEAQIREALIEAALEKVRSRTLAMQKSDELPETAAVLFKQLIGLNIAPNRLYIGVIHEETSTIEFWVTDEDGSKVSTMYSGKADKNFSVKKMYDGWKRQEKSTVVDMQGSELTDYLHYLSDELHVPFKDSQLQKRRIQYLAYFSHGFIGMASPDEQPRETLELLERFAYVFNLTFTRFSDLKIAEALAIQAEEDLINLQTAKKRAEDALSELQAAQKQLIQSEKMASLGELTAGIAHEIQNPLNFVNNFAKASTDLVEELEEETQKSTRDTELETDILDDVKQNLQKIAHHGQRASAIVGGMLEHTRVRSGQQEPTLLNLIVDEYQRLAYQSTRAKDPSFACKLTTDFDAEVGLVNVVPQDIGRVLLNLYNNAFYAVSQRQKMSSADYKPEVSVRTRRNKAGIEIRVGDNGNGIPKKILDKIFQPFFTTKPTGQGTGLGLSLSFDIVKAHGGALQVESEEGSGAVFTVTLPG